MLKIKIYGDVDKLEQETEYVRIERKIGDKTCIVVPKSDEVYFLDTEDNERWILLAAARAPFSKEITVYDSLDYLINDLINHGITSDDIVVTDLENVNIDINVHLQGKI